MCYIQLYELLVITNHISTWKLSTFHYFKSHTKQRYTESLKEFLLWLNDKDRLAILMENQEAMGRNGEKQEETG